MIRRRHNYPGLFLVLSLLMGAGTSSASAQAVEGTLTLDEAIGLARQHNPNYLMTANNQDAADWGFRESLGGFLPSASTSVSGQYLAPGVPSTGIYTGSDFGIGSTDYYFSGYNLTLSYSLSGNSFFQVASSKANQNATRAEVRAAEFTLESDVTAQYLAALRAREGVEVAQRQLDRAEGNYELAQARADVGAVIPTDAKQADVERGRAQVALIEAESLLRTEKLRLLEQLGVEARGDFELVSEFEVFDPQWNREELVERALARHPRLQASRARESAGKAGIRQAWSRYFPTISFAANWSGRARQIGDEAYLLGQNVGSVMSAKSNCEFMNEISAGLSQPLSGYPRDCGQYVFSAADSARVLHNNNVFPFQWSPEPLSLYLQVSVPLFQGFTRQRQIEEAKAAAEDARYSRRAEELRVQTAVNQAYDELMAANSVVQIESRNREVAEEQLDLARERYSLGAATFLELLEAQSSLAAAERDFLNARYRFHGAIWALEAAVGGRLRPEADAGALP